MEMANKKRPASRQAHTSRFYPVWGAEEPRYVSNAYELYRYGERGFFTRYIVPPADVIDKRRHAAHKPLLGVKAYELLRYGLTVSDVVLAVSIGILGAASLLFLTDQFGTAFDRYADLMNW